MQDSRLAAALVRAADTLTDGFDVTAHLRRVSGWCAELLAARAVGIMLLDGERGLILAGSGCQQGLAVALLEAQRDGGPCRESLRTGRAVRPVSLRSPQVAARWPEFAERAARGGVGTTFAVPVREGEGVVGALNVCLPSVSSGTDELAGDARGEARGDALRVAQAVADAVALGLRNHRAYDRYRTLSGQLEHALSSRVRIEQAKGMLAERQRTDPESAFEVMRRYARKQRLPLDLVARRIIERSCGEGELGGVGCGTEGFGAEGFEGAGFGGAGFGAAGLDDAASGGRAGAAPGRPPYVWQDICGGA